MDTGRFVHLTQSISRPGTRRAMLAALVGSVVAGRALDTAGRGKTRRKGKRQRVGRVQAEGKPEFIGPIHDEGTVDFVECDGFTILDQFELDFSIKWLTDKNGTRVRGVEHVSGTDTFINAETGKSIAAPFHNNVLIDPQAGLGANVGVIYKVTVPGAGAVFLDVGRIVTNRDGTIVTFQAGPHQAFEGDFAGLCAALA